MQIYNNVINTFPGVSRAAAIPEDGYGLHAAACVSLLSLTIYKNRYCLGA